MLELQDPENILAPPQPGHISRRSFEKKYQNEEERKIAMEEAAHAELLKLRAAREVLAKTLDPPHIDGCEEMFSKAT